MKQKLTSQFKFSIKGLKFESRVSLLRLLSISWKAHTLKLIGKKISSSLRPRNEKLAYQNNRSVKTNYTVRCTDFFLSHFLRLGLANSILQHITDQAYVYDQSFSCYRET